LIGKWNDARYEAGRTDLQEYLDDFPLSEALSIFHNQQTDIGYIADSLSEVRYFQSHNDDGRFFIAQVNPRRADRPKGAGRNVPPLGAKTVNAPADACFLCYDNVRWQSRGVQMYYCISVNGNKYAILSNPFPFMPLHMTVASTDHEPQSWHENNLWKDNKIVRIVSDLYALSEKLPEYIGFFNGVGAGASIEGHYHYQFFQTPKGHGVFPIQLVASRVFDRERKSAFMENQRGTVLYVGQDNYPIPFFRLAGAKDNILESAIDLINRWNDTIGELASANIICLKEGEERVIYFVPRNRCYKTSTGFAGIVGGLEAMGEFIFTTPEEIGMISRQTIDYNYMSQILAGVRPPCFERMRNK
jgi:hypothetical protein